MRIDLPRMGLTLTLAFAGCGVGAGLPGPTVPPAELPSTRRGTLVDEVLLTGEVVAAEAVSLVAPNVGIWPLQLRWIVEDGATVAAGDPVVEFDTAGLVVDIEQKRAQVTTAGIELERAELAAEVEIEQARHAVARAEVELRRSRLLADVPEQLLAAREHEERQVALRRAEMDVEEAREQLTAAEAISRAEVALRRLDLDNARAEVERAERGMELLTLRATRDGVVSISDNAQEGRGYRAGDPVHPGSVVALLPDLGTLYVAARLFDVDDGRVAPGMPVRATLDAFPEVEMAGRVVEVDGLAQPIGRSQRRAFDVRVEVGGLDPRRMRPGMSVLARVEAQRLADRLLVPRSAVLDDRVRLADGSWRPVEVGLCSAHWCELVDGLDEGVRLGRTP